MSLNKRYIEAAEANWKVAAPQKGIERLTYSYIYEEIDGPQEPLNLLTT